MTRPFLKMTAIFRCAVLAAVGMVAAFVCLSVYPAAVSAQTQESITAYVVDVTVREDGRVVVTESIDYYFPSARHGIYRDIPTRYEDEQGSDITVPVTVSGVLDADGQPWPFKVSKERYGVNIRIGDPNRTITGTQRYVITYVAEGAIRYLEDHDELYWNITGDQWTVPIQSVEATVNLPGSVRGSEIRTKCFTGPAGSTEQDCLANVQASAAYFAADDFLTVVVGFPKGRVAVLLPKTSIFAGLVPLLPFLLPILAFAFMFRRWWTKGRDAEGRETIMVQYEQPDEMRPAEIGVLMDETANIHDITSTIVDLAVRGYLKIQETEPKGLIFKKKDFKFIRTDKNTVDLKDYEMRIYNTIFSGVHGALLSKLTSSYAFADELPKIRTALYEEVVRGGYFPVNPDKVRTGYVAGGIAFTFALFILSMFLGASMQDALVPGALQISVVLTGIIIVGFGVMMPKKTHKGTAAFEHAAGFKEYIAKAEKYRLEWQEKEKMFEKLLPFAMAFGIVDKYTDAFKGIDMERPDWYEGQGGLTAFNAATFASSFSAFDSAMGKAITSKPQQTSSGSGFSSGGGGGFSGGGFGGGGGGSW